MDIINLNDPLTEKNSKGINNQDFHISETPTNEVKQIKNTILLINPSSGSNQGSKLLEIANQHFSDDPLICFINIMDKVNFQKGILILKEIQVP